jgi:hypothetical protein
MRPDLPPEPPPDSPTAGGDDRRHGDDRRQVPDRRQRDVPVAHDRRSGEDRRLVQRRAPRNINGYELGADELELIHAVNAHKARTGRAFPTWSELLQIVRSLGYEKRR